MTEELSPEAVQIHQVCCYLRSLQLDQTGIILMDGKTNMIRQPRTGVVCLGENLNEVKLRSQHRVTDMTRMSHIFTLT